MKNRIQELRKEWRITQSELADAVEVTRQTIISLENGKYKVRWFWRIRLRSTLGCRLRTFLYLIRRRKTYVV